MYYFANDIFVLLIAASEDNNLLTRLFSNFGCCICILPISITQFHGTYYSEMRFADVIGIISLKIINS